MEQTSITVEAIDLARHIIDMIADKKGEEIVLLDIHRPTLIDQYFRTGSILVSLVQTRRVATYGQKSSLNILDSTPVSISRDVES